MTFILPSFGASAIAAVPGGGGGAFSNTYSVDLDGSNEYVDIGDLTALNSASTFSMSMWWKTPSSSEKIMVGSDSTTGIGMYQWSDGSFYVHAGASNVFGSGITPPGYNQWNFVLVTYNSSGDVKAYFNGSTTPANTASATALGASAGDGFRIGKYEGYPTAYSEGFIDEVAIFSSELSSSDSATLWNSGVPADISSLNPVGYWRMGDSDTGVSNGSSTPTIVSNVANSSAIKNHYALDFDGSNDELTIPQGTFNLGTGNWTFSMWVNADTLSGSSGLFLIKGGASLIFSLWLTPTAFTCSNWYANNLTASGTFNTNTWYHLVAVKYGLGSTDIHLYVDGSKVTEGYHPTYSGNYGSDTQDAQLGNATNDGTSYPFDGKIDEFGFWKSALTAANITSIYNSGVPADLGSGGLDLNPTGWWRMGDGGTWDGSNWSIPDASVNSNTATSANMVEADRVTDTPTANGILVNGPIYSNIAP